MTDALFALVPTYGPYLILASVLLSCLAVPLPSSVLVLAAGGFAASGDLDLRTVALAAFGGFVLGDQLAYQLGRRGGTALRTRLAHRPKASALLAKAERLVAARGAGAVFLSRTVVSPLAAYVAYAGAAAGLGWARFTVPAVLGALVWSGTYVGLGYGFTDRMTDIANLLGNLAGVVIALAVMAGAGLWLRRSIRDSAARRAAGQGGDARSA